MEAIILAGGLGTRLRSVVSDKPKALAVLGKLPFLFYLITDLKKKGINRFIFSLGYLHEQIKDFLKLYFPDLNYVCVVESEPLGTGGALKLCFQEVSNNIVLLANADTFFDIDITAALTLFDNNNADCVIVLTELENFDRYGVVKVLSDKRVTEFLEKKKTVKGLINTGLILLNRNVFQILFDNYSGIFSFEKDILEPNIESLRVFGSQQTGYFIDIGIPSDYAKAQNEISYFENILEK